MRLVLGRFSTRDRQVLGRFLDRDWQVDDIRSGSRQVLGKFSVGE